MILNNYIFSFDSQRYQQYTTDQSETIIKQVCKGCNAKNQIVFHRDENLAYYVYTQKNSFNEILGICIVCGEVCLNLKWLYDSLHKIIESVAYKGIIFCYDEKSGEIKKNIQDFSLEKAEVDCLLNEIRRTLSAPSKWETLPSVNFGIPITSKINLAFSEDSNLKITDALRHYPNVIVTLENIAPSSYSMLVKSQNEEKVKLLKDKEGLENKISYLTRQKKQYKWVSILAVCVIASLIGLYFLNDNLSGIISNQNNAISQLELTIDDNNIYIQCLKDTLKESRMLIKQKDGVIRKLNANLVNCKDSLKESLDRNDELASMLFEEQTKFKSLKSTFPINIIEIAIGNTYYDGSIETNFGSTIYSSYTMYLTPKITYTGINVGRSINLKIKWFDSNGNLRTGKSSPNGFSQQKTLSVKSGYNTETLQGWGSETKGHWGKGTYRIEIWCESICLKAQAFTIY